MESSARLKDGILYIGSSDYTHVFAIEAATGKEVWRRETPGWNWSSPAVTEKSVFIGGAGGGAGYYAGRQGSFIAMDRATGRINSTSTHLRPPWRYPMSQIPGSFTHGVASSPAVDPELVFFGGLDEVFYAFRAEG